MTSLDFRQKNRANYLKKIQFPIGANSFCAHKCQLNSLYPPFPHPPFLYPSFPYPPILNPPFVSLFSWYSSRPESLLSYIPPFLSSCSECLYENLRQKWRWLRRNDSRKRYPKTRKSNKRYEAQRKGVYM